MQDCSDYQNANFELALQVKSLKDELSLTFRSKETVEDAKNSLLDKFNIFSEQQQKNYDEKLLDLKRKQKEKKEKLFEKILSLKLDSKSQLESSDLYINDQRIQMEDLKSQYEQIISQLQSDMKKIKNEWLRKVKEQSLQFEKDFAEAEAKHSI